MALTIEDGSLVEGADSYITLEEARAYAAKRGLSLPSADDKVEALLILAMDYLETGVGEYKGAQVDASQSLQWPRSGVYLTDDSEDALDETSIPSRLKLAQAQLAYDLQSVDPTPVGKGKEVIRTKVEGAVETQYAPNGDVNPQPEFTKVLNYLAPLLESSGDEISLTCDRA